MSAVGQTILIVDDDRGVRITLSAILEGEGYHTIEAENGREAVGFVAEQPGIELVLSDIRMPEMDGVEALGRIHALRPELPVVLATAYAIEELEDQALRNGVYTVLGKPYDIDQLLALIARAIRAPAILVMDGPDGERLIETLASHGHRAIAASTAEAAVESIRSGPVDVAILDLAHGLAALEALRAAEPRLPIVLIAEESADATRHLAARLGIAGWISRRDPGLSLVRAVVQVRRRAEEARS